jgi:hypothetical protein
MQSSDADGFRFGDLGFTVVCVFLEQLVIAHSLWALLTGGRNGEICARSGQNIGANISARVSVGNPELWCRGGERRVG